MNRKLVVLKVRMIVALREVGLYDDWSRDWSVCVGFL